MKTNRLLLTAAGSGKTTYLVDQACEYTNESVLITTYTITNEAEIKKCVYKKKGYIPSNITIQTWFSFLLQHGVKPYQSILNNEIHNELIGFFLSNERSGKIVDKNNQPIMVNGCPRYWPEANFKKFYFTDNYKIYSDKISKFVVDCNEKSGGLVMDRISRIFRNIFVDEVQDLAGYDLEVLKLFFKSTSSILLVGDPRQVTYLTNHAAKHEKYSNGLIKEYFKNEIKGKVKYEIDEKTLNLSHRNNNKICTYSAKLYPLLPIPSPCTCDSCRRVITDHEGVFIVQPKYIDKYLSKFNPIQLRWDAKRKCNPNFKYMNMGESKGLTFERVLIFPTTQMEAWIRNNDKNLSDITRAKLYVAITRAKRSVAIVMDYQKGEKFEGIDEYIL